MDWHSPYVIPLGAFTVAIVAIVSGIVSEAHKMRLKADQRMTMVARGMSAEDIDKLLGTVERRRRSQQKDPLRSLGNARRSGDRSHLLLESASSLFGLLLTWIVREQHDVLVVAAAGLIPLAIGIGFLVDYSMQK